MPHVYSASVQMDIQDIICDPALVASGMHFVVPHEPKLKNHRQ